MKGSVLAGQIMNEYRQKQYYAKSEDKSVKISNVRDVSIGSEEGNEIQNK